MKRTMKLLAGVMTWLAWAAPLTAQDYLFVPDPQRAAEQAVATAAAHYENQTQGFSDVLAVSASHALPWIDRVRAAHVELLDAQARLHDAYAAADDRDAALTATSAPRLDPGEHITSAAHYVDTMRASEASLAQQAVRDPAAAAQLEIVTQQRVAAEQRLFLLNDLASGLPDLQKDRAMRAERLRRSASANRSIGESYRTERRLWEDYYTALAAGIRSTDGH